MNSFIKKVATPIIIGLCLLVAGIAFTIPNLSAAEGDETTYYLLTDHLGSVDAVLDEDGNVVERRDYLPYGSERVAQKEPGAPETAHGFTGKELDDETGLSYYGARYYDAVSGRFVQADPLILNIAQMSADQRNAFLSDPQNLNAYSYVKDNPLRYIDPTGHYGKDVHLYLTDYLASQAGFTDLDAFSIGFYDQMTDSDPTTDPWASQEARQQYHFATPEQIGELHSQALEAMDYKDIGRFLHAFQDSYSHAGYGPTIGHVLDEHAPDQTYLAVDKAMEMARTSFFHLRTFNLKKLGMTDAGAIESYNNESTKIWENISGDVEDYLELELKQISEIAEEVDYKDKDAENE